MLHERNALAEDLPKGVGTDAALSGLRWPTNSQDAWAIVKTAERDDVRKRLQFRIGPAVRLGNEAAPTCDRRRFVALTTSGEPGALVTLHRAPPVGPDPATMQTLLGRLRGLRLGVLDLPMLDGEMDGAWWVVERIAVESSAGDLVDRGRLSVLHAGFAIRDLARAVMAMHRAKLTHGAITLETIRITATGATLGGFCFPGDGSVRVDLEALSRVAWAMLSGERDAVPGGRLSELRRGVPRALDLLADQLQVGISSGRPISAAAILGALDAMPGRRVDRSAEILAVGPPRARPVSPVTWAVAAGAIVLMIALLAIQG
jgi:hypothetical protein